ncbi:MAG TPA: SDR family NAD(P)-dependent oxidoreductase [Nitrososphaeraceae archaeon]
MWKDMVAAIRVPNMTFQIKLLITGGTGALGRSITKAFIASNATTTIVTYIIKEEMENLKSETKSAAVELIRTDITKNEEVKKLISEIIEKHRSIDVLVNVVGGYLGGKSVSELEEQEWDIMMNLNLKSAFLISKHVIPIMMAAKYGKMVHVSSRTALKSDGYDSAYAASKSGLIRLIESISQEVKESNVNVNCIMPSIIDTEANRKAMPNSEFSKWIKPEELANVVLFLCSEDAKVINGAAMPTYGLS